VGGGGRGAVGVSVDAALEGWSGIYTCAPRHSVKRQLTAATCPLVQLPLVLPVSPVIQGAAHDPLDICLPLSPGCFVSPCPTLLCGRYGVCGEDRCLGIPFVPLPSTGAPLCSDADAQAPTREQSLRSCSNPASLRSFRFALTFSFRALPLHPIYQRNSPHSSYAAVCLLG
jgi:hypothetical protein